MFLSDRENPDSNLFSILSFGIEIHKEKIAENGEDSYLYAFDDDSGIISVMDGCGGSGAKKYPRYKEKTGAYMASRVVAGAVRDWFIDLHGQFELHKDIDSLKDRIKEYLCLCKQYSGATATIKGSIAKEFPTTLALTLCERKNDNIQATVIWAGDSRCYLLDEEGLKQLTEDDVDGLDSLENLTADGVLKNVISISKDFTLHNKTIQVLSPSMIIVATDGCFGYYSTPMEFEYLLLDTLLTSHSPSDWEQKITNALDNVSGDDFTLCGAAFGFESFENIKSTMLKRCENVKKQYIDKLENATQELKIKLWDEYKKDYLQYCIRTI